PNATRHRPHQQSKPQRHQQTAFGAGPKRHKTPPPTDSPSPNATNKPRLGPGPQTPRRHRPKRHEDRPTAYVCPETTDFAGYEEDTRPLPSGHAARRRLGSHAGPKAFEFRFRAADATPECASEPTLRSRAVGTHSLDARSSAGPHAARSGLG